MYRTGSTYRGDPDRYVVKRGGGCLMLFGLPFFAAGVAVMVLGVLGKMTSESGGPPPLVIIIPFGLIFASVGAGLMFGRAGIVIDKRSGTVTKWWGLLVPFKRTTFPVEKIRAVTITSEVRRSKNSTYTVYPVRLIGPAEPLNVEEPRDSDRARRRAEELAKFLDLGVEDSSSGKKVVREAGTLDESLRDRYRREGRPRERPGEPAGCRIVSGASGSEATFDIPPKGFAAVEVIGMVIGAIFAFVPLIIGGVLLGESGPKDIEKAWPFLIFVGLFMLVWMGIPFAMIVTTIKKARARERLSVSPRELRLDRKTFFGTKTTIIPADELEELDLGSPGSERFPPMSAGVGKLTSGSAGTRIRMGNHPLASLFGLKGVVKARSDRVTLTFGAGLGPEELKWLRDVVLFIVTA
ncbi:MAG: hypothetical protein ACYSU0_14125 [Planctomycetota bacterium]|jgi:hypothetical protein